MNLNKLKNTTFMNVSIGHTSIKHVKLNSQPTNNLVSNLFNLQFNVQREYTKIHNFYYVKREYHNTIADTTLFDFYYYFRDIGRLHHVNMYKNSSQTLQN